MNTVSLYRWEHIETGKGPYNCYGIFNDDDVKQYNLTCSWSLFEHNDNILHPSFGYEVSNNYCIVDDKFIHTVNNNRFTGIPAQNVKFAFASINDMEHWFNEHEIALMQKLGFGLFNLTVPAESVNYLLTQAIYIDEDVICKKLLKLTKYEKNQISY